MARGPDLGSLRPLIARERAVFSPGVRGLVALVFVLAAVQTVRHDEAFLWLGLVTAGTLALMVPLLEWRLGTDRLLLSLPVRRAGLVRARYAMAALGIVVAWVAWLAAGHLLAPALAPGRSGPDSWATLAGSLAFFWLGALVLSAFLPLHFRLGLGRAAAAFFPVLLALYLAALATATGTDLVRAGDGLARLVPPGTLAGSAAESLIGRIGGAGTIAVVAVGIVALMAGSAALSIRGFRRRDL